LLLLKDEKYCPVLDSVAVLLLDAFMIFDLNDFVLIFVGTKMPWKLKQAL